MDLDFQNYLKFLMQRQIFYGFPNGKPGSSVNKSWAHNWVTPGCAPGSWDIGGNGLGCLAPWPLTQLDIQPSSISLHYSAPRPLPSTTCTATRSCKGPIVPWSGQLTLSALSSGTCWANTPWYDHIQPPLHPRPLLICSLCLGLLEKSDPLGTNYSNTACCVTVPLFLNRHC